MKNISLSFDILTYPNKSTSSFDLNEQVALDTLMNALETTHDTLFTVIINISNHNIHTRNKVIKKLTDTYSKHITKLMVVCNTDITPYYNLPNLAIKSFIGHTLIYTRTAQHLLNCFKQKIYDLNIKSIEYIYDMQSKTKFYKTLISIDPNLFNRYVKFNEHIVGFVINLNSIDKLTQIKYVNDPILSIAKYNNLHTLNTLTTDDTNTKKLELINNPIKPSFNKYYNKSDRLKIYQTFTPDAILTDTTNIKKFFIILAWLFTLFIAINCLSKANLMNLYNVNSLLYDIVDLIQFIHIPLLVFATICLMNSILQLQSALSSQYMQQIKLNDDIIEHHIN